MSNEINTVVRITCKNGNYNDSWSISPKFNQLVSGAIAGTQVANISGANLVVTGLATPGWLLVRNLDTINNINLGGFASGVTVPFAKLLPGEWGAIRTDPAATIRVVAQSGNPGLQFWWLNS